MSKIFLFIVLFFFEFNFSRIFKVSSLLKRILNYLINLGFHKFILIKKVALKKKLPKILLINSLLQSFDVFFTVLYVKRIN